MAGYANTRKEGYQFCVCQTAYAIDFKIYDALGKGRCLRTGFHKQNKMLQEDNQLDIVEK